MRRSLLPLSILLIVPVFASARPAHKRALAEFLGPFMTPKLNDCRTCHLPDPPGKKESVDEEKPHNAFGVKVREIRKQLRKEGKPSDIASAVQAIAEEDADGDGVPNLLELLTGNNPGDGADKPAPARVTEGRRMLVEFARRNTAYPWRPFERVLKPPLPETRNSKLEIRNGIDRFIAQEHEQRGLTPRPEAGKATLLRRVYLDLIGLPPSPEELHAFLADSSPDAYERVVDRLLNSAQYGERWGRHWMDVWRYSDWAGWTGGGQIRDSQPHIWRWRDWIIEALNEDKGYDRMIVEMLAADELLPDDPKALRATGYLVRNYKMLSREKWMQDVVDHTGQAFLGVTIGCAKCHDHMYDPLTQKEYYQMRAIFEPHQVRTDRIPGQADTKKDGLVRAYDANATVPTYFFIRGDDRTPDKTKAIVPGVPESLGGKPFKVELVNLPKYAATPDRQPFVMQELIAESERTVKLHDKDVLAAERRQRMAQMPIGRPGGTLSIAGPLWDALLESAVMSREAAVEAVRKNRLLAEVERLEDDGKTNTAEWHKAAKELTASERRFAWLKARNQLHTLRNGLSAHDPKNKTPIARQIADAEQVATKTGADLKLPASTNYTKRQVTSYPATSTGRRLAFARWIADRDNPLTARVAVNHIWLRHFGQPLVPRVFDFGRNGRPPSHPAMLDWLAVELMDSGWSTKHLHRLIVTSSTYRQDSTPDAENLKHDPDNTYLWRMAPRRLEAEVVRDCVFHIAGRLDMSFSGADIDQNLGLTVPRRSLYFRHAPEKQMEFLKLFDVASPTECYMRKESILPQQALALINSDLTRQHARILARKLINDVGRDPAKFITAAFENVLSRAPTVEEQGECMGFLAEESKRLAATTGKPSGNDPDGKQPSGDILIRPAENLVHVLMNHHEFVTVR